MVVAGNSLSRTHLEYLIAFLVLLIVVSAFFSGTETGMMALNRYRLRHMANKGNRRAIRVVNLLQRPDRLIGLILIGNTFANIIASAIATTLATAYFGDWGVVVSSIVLALVILIFAETTPKTWAALYPERVAFPASLIISFSLKLFYPLVWIINGIANGCLRLFNVRVSEHGVETLTPEELHTIVKEASGTISSSYQQILLSVLDLGQITVNEVMVPRNQIQGIDIDDDWENILHSIYLADHDHIPIYRETIDNVIGILDLRRLVGFSTPNKLSKDKLIRLTTEIYYIPEVTHLSQQLLNFREEQKKVGLVVDEYGDIQGLLALQDILEEIVGEFTLVVEGSKVMPRKLEDGSYLVDGRVNVRDLNRITGWDLKITGPKTLSGLIISHLDSIPISNVGVRISGYPMEVMKVKGNAIRLVKVWPEQWIFPRKESD